MMLRRMMVAVCLVPVICVGCADSGPDGLSGDDASLDGGLGPADTADDTADDGRSGAVDAIADGSPDVDGPADADADSAGCRDDDGDGLCRDTEQALGTDPEAADSDSDGIWDGWETAAGTDPLNPADRPDYQLPAGDAYALEITDFVEPSAIAGLVSSRLDDAPPVLLFADGLTDGRSDAPVALVGGLGALVGAGQDDTPGTTDDVYAMTRSSIKQTNGEFNVQLSGQADQLGLTATAETILLDLSGISAATEGLSLRVDDVALSGTLSQDLQYLGDLTLNGRLSEAGVEALVDAVKDRLPVSKEDILNLLDPDGDGIIPVELELDGRRVVVDGFTAPEDDNAAQPRPSRTCCPPGLDVGDPIYPALTWQDQGIQDDELSVYQLAVEQLQEDPDVAMFATARRDEATGQVTYSVYNGGAMPTGHIDFERVAGEGGADETFEIVDQDGVNPLENTDPTAFGTYEDVISAGLNPQQTTYADKGYIGGDERLGFVPADQMHYGFAFDRLAQYFDDPRAGDLVVLPPTWSMGGFGTHGHLGNLQSRSPLIMAGPGIRSADGAAAGADGSVETLADGSPALVVDQVGRAVDIAPTVAAALGVAPTTGVGPDGRLRDDVRLAWQDGRVLDQVFTDAARQQIQDGQAVAEHAVIIINDGLTSNEILYEALADAADGFEVDQYRRLMSRGMAFRYGSITNYPSNTYPSHNAVGSGAWSGHHGLLDNHFWVRATGADENPIEDVFGTEYLLGSAHPGLPVETLHEAIGRSFGPDILTASINDPSTRGAPLATLERRYPDGFSLPDAADTVTIDHTDYALPEVDVTDYAGVLDNASAQTFASIYTDNAVGLPKYTVVNFSSTDTAGHSFGPHGDQERQVVIPRVNQRLEVVFAALRQAGILDDTLIVLTSDHGMELQDRQRRGSTVNQLSQASTPVRFRRTRRSVYFKLLAVDVGQNDLQAGQPSTLTLDVHDSDTRWGPQAVAVADAPVRVVDGGTLAESAATDADGHVELEVAVDADATDILVEIGGPDWTTYRKRVPVQ